MPASLFGEGIQALVGAALGAGGMGSAWLATRSTRERRANELYDKIMEGVRAENADLRAEVEECKRRDVRSRTVELVVRVAMPELQRLDPGNGVLRHCAMMLRALPPINSDGPEWADLLAQIDAKTPNYVAPTRGAESFGRDG